MAETALSVAAQHGVEFNQVRERIQVVEGDIRDIRHKVDSLDVRMDLLIRRANRFMQNHPESEP